jgi:uncharacterized OB-fold protein
MCSWSERNVHDAAPTPAPRHAGSLAVDLLGALLGGLCPGRTADPALHRLCWRCHSRELIWEVSTGRGRLYSWTIVWRPQTPEFEVPYAVAIVDLVEGCQLISGIVGCAPEDLVVGMELAVEFHPNSDHLRLPYFRPVG